MGMNSLSAISLREDRFSGSSTPYKVDREKGIISGIKVIGEQSANGRRYSRRALNSAVRLYEGIKVNLDHPPVGKPDNPRSVMERFGKLVNVRTVSEGIFADLHYNPKHSQAEAIAWWAENDPSAIGMSHNADGKIFKRNGETVVEEITNVRHVDIVADPATTKGLYEATMNTKPLSEVIAGLEQKSKGREFLQALIENEMLPADAAMPAPSSPEEALKSGFKAAIHAIIDDDGMDLAAKVSKIKELLKMQEKAMGGGETEKPAEEKPAPESKQPDDKDKRLALLERKDKVRELCDAADYKPTKSMLEALVAVNDETAKALIEEAKKTQAPAVGKTRSAALTESRNGGGNEKLPDDPKALKAALWN